MIGAPDQWADGRPLPGAPRPLGADPRHLPAELHGGPEDIPAEVLPPSLVFRLEGRFAPTGLHLASVLQPPLSSLRGARQSIVFPIVTDEKDV